MSFITRQTLQKKNPGRVLYETTLIIESNAKCTTDLIVSS